MRRVGMGVESNVSVHEQHSQWSACRVPEKDGQKRIGAVGSTGGKPKRRDRKLDKFLERQKTGPWEIRRATSLLQREVVRSCQEEYDVAFWGAHGADGFRKKLISQYGSVSTAWRVALDKQDIGKLSFAEYITQCREIGFGGNLKKVWKELDTDRDGFITLMDLDVDAHKAISTFMTLLFEKFGSTLQGWRQGLDVNGTHRLDEKEFVERCAALGYDGDAKALFRLLRIDPHNKCITLKEIDPQAASALQCGDPCAEHLSEGGRSSPTRSPEPRCFSRQATRHATNDSTGLLGTRSTLNDTTTTLPAGFSAASLASREVSPPGSPASSSTAKARHRQPPGELQLTLDRTLDDRPGSSPSMPRLDRTLDDRPGSSPSMPRSMSDGSMLGSPMHRRQHLGAVTPTRTSTWIRELSNFQRAEGADRKQKQDEADKGVKTVAGLRSMLLSRYGTMYAAWRQALDIHEKGQLSFGELCEALRHRCGYTGSLKAIWNDLDSNQTGFISLKDLDPKQHAIISEYKELVKQKYGNLLTGWVQGIDRSNQGCVDEAGFAEHCKLVGFVGDSKSLFRSLQSDQRCKFLYIRDWDIRASRALSRGDTNMITEEHKEAKTPSTELSFNERQETSFHQRWARFQSKEKIADLYSTFKEARDADVAAGDLDSFKQVLIRKYGTLASAWRCGLNPEGLPQLPFNEFASVLRKQGFSGSVRRLWNELDSDGLGYVTLANFDPDIDKLLGSFRAQLTQRFGDIITGWLEGLDPNAVGRIEEAEFLKRFKQLGLEGDARKIFANLQERGRSFVVLKDIEPKAMDAVFRGDLKAKTMKSRGEKHATTMSIPQARSPGGTPLPPLDPSTTATPTSAENNGGESPSSVQGLQSPNNTMLKTRLSEWSEELGRKMRHETIRLDKEEKDKWMGCTSLDGFRQMLVDRYGSTVTAWRCVLDGDGNGRLSFNEFCRGCRSLSYHGNVKELWAKLKGDIVGHVSLENLDPEADRLLRCFREHMLSKFECLLDAWHEWLDDGRNVWLDEAEFQYKLEESGYDVGGPKQCHQLFLSLMPDKSSRHLHVEDLQAVLIGVPNVKRHLLWMGDKKPPPPVGHHDPVGRPLEVLKGVLAKKFGCIYAGWWRGIDVTRAGRVSMADFDQATLTIGYPGNMKALHRALEKDAQDFVMLRDIDAEIATALDSFRDIVNSAYGSFKEAWQFRLDFHKTGYVEETVFLEFCAEIGYRRNAKALFKMLNPVSGRSCLFFEDFGYLSLPPDVRSASRNREPEAPWRRRESPESPTRSPIRSPILQQDKMPAWQAAKMEEAARQATTSTRPGSVQFERSPEPAPPMATADGNDSLMDV